MNLRGGGLVSLPGVSSKFILSAIRQDYHHTPTTRGRAVAARVAHNHKVAGSSPAPATRTRAHLRMGFCSGTEADANLRLAQAPSLSVGRRFGVARTRAGASSEHAGAEKDEVRCPAPDITFIINHSTIIN